MAFTTETVKNIIRKVIKSENYRDEGLIIIDDLFLNYCIDFFKRVVDAKIKNEDITIDWYKKEFLNKSLSAKEIAIHSGINIKSITNGRNSARREVVVEEAEKNYRRLYNTIKELVSNDKDINLTLTIKFRTVSVDLSVTESLIIINTLAVKRSEIRGGIWSTAGKQVEKPLIITLCKLFDVKFEYFDQSDNPKSFREVDFYLLSSENKKLRIEVKLMGKGNPESADAIFAREPQIFVADKLSAKNKKQAEDLNIEWVELRSEDGYTRFTQILDKYKIPYMPFTGDIDKKLDRIFEEIFK